MKAQTENNLAGRIRFAIPFLAIFLLVSPVSAEAGLLDTVNSKVTNILNRVKQIGSNTSGLQEFITTLRDVRDSLGGGMISDMRDSIGETQQLIQFIKDRRESAGQTSQYPSLPNLVRSLDGIAEVLLERDGQGGALEGLSALLDVLPDKALAPVARTISRIGIDGDFVMKIDRMATDLVDLREILNETAARRDSASQVAGMQWLGEDELFIAEFGCHVRDSLQLVRLSRVARGVKRAAELVKIKATLLEAKSSLLNVDKGVGIWGWVSAKVDVDAEETIAKIMTAVADGALMLVDVGEKTIEICLAEKPDHNQSSIFN